MSTATLTKPLTEIIPDGCEHGNCICRQCGHQNEDGTCLEKFPDCAEAREDRVCPVEQCEYFTARS